MSIAFNCPYCHICLKKTKESYSCSECVYQLTLMHDIWVNKKLFLPERFSQKSREHLTTMESKHFWFYARKLLLKKLTAKLLSGIPEPITLELGCGNGTFLPILSQFSHTIVGIDGHFSSLKEANKLSPHVTLIHGDINHIPYKNNSFDFICAFDVLEHVEPLPLLHEIHQKLLPNGKLLLSVPAFKSLWSSVDEKAGHRCRYTHKQLEEELKRSGFKLLGWTHYQFLLFPLLWIMRRIASRNGRSNVEAKPSAFINSILGWINRFEVYTFSFVRLPFGSSLIVWAEPLPPTQGKTNA